MLQVGLIDDRQVETVGEAVLRTLAEVGVLCQNEELRTAIRAAGGTCRAGDVVTIPRRVAAAFIAGLRADAVPAAGAERFPRLSPPSIGTQVAPIFLDYGASVARQGNRTDFVSLLKLGEMLPGGPASGHVLSLTDVPAAVEPLEAALLMAQYSSNPSPAFAIDASQVDYLIEMGEILGRRDWFSWGATCFAHPLRFDRAVADKFVRRVRAGGAAGITAMPVIGVSTPVTVAGFLAVAAAEFVATWFAGRAISPTAPLGGSIWVGSVDMRTGDVSYSALDAMRHAFVLAEFLRRFAGQSIPVGGGEYSAAKVPGYYAVLEKAYKAMMIAAFSGRHPSIGQGMLDNGRIMCPVQLLLEREFTQGVDQLGRPFEVNDETLAWPTIAAVGQGLTDNYLAQEHTLTRFRETLWLPAIYNRGGWTGPAMERTVLDRLRQQYLDLLAAYRRPVIDPDKIAALEAVLARARRQLLA